ncbi:MAG: hypothetical protein J2P21_00585 [Chloracidobacterium sp.]|nr:hypothetical protein [Chloracidobacterium sp.]
MPEKCSFKIGNVRINNVAEATFLMNAPKTDLGIPKMDMLNVMVRVRINLNDSQNIKREDINQLFDLCYCLDNTARVKDVALEFWEDLSQKDPTAAYQFKGWISSFRTSNVAGDVDTQARDIARYNHVLDLELTPDTTSGNFKSLKFGS